MDDLEIYFDDLTEDAQRKVLELYGLDSAEDGNFDNSPLFILEYEEMEDEDIENEEG